MTAQDVAWEAYRPHAAEHDVTPCMRAFDAGWTAATDHIRQLAGEVGASYQPCPCDPGKGIGDPNHRPVPFADVLDGES